MEQKSSSRVLVGQVNRYRATTKKNPGWLWAHSDNDFSHSLFFLIVVECSRVCPSMAIRLRPRRESGINKGVCWQEKRRGGVKEQGTDRSTGQGSVEVEEARSDEVGQKVSGFFSALHPLY